jgi:hypothetical protein
MLLLKLLSKKIASIKELNKFKQERKRANSYRNGYYYLKKSQSLIDKNN